VDAMMIPKIKDLRQKETVMISKVLVAPKRFFPGH
jgi:hypothetical protein